MGACLVLGLSMLVAASMPARAAAPPPVYATNCSCHTDPHSPYPAQLNAANNTQVIQNALNQNMTGLGAGQPALTAGELSTIASYIQGELTAAPTATIPFQTATSITLHEISVPSTYGAYTGLATTSSGPKGSPTAYFTGPARATYTPNACTVGPDSFTWHATGSHGNSSDRVQPVSISNPSSPPTINSSAAPSTGTTGVSYSHTATVSACPGLVTWSFTGTLPPGVLFSSGGVLSGTPTTPGVYTGNLVATYVGGQASTQAFSITISLGAPAFTSGTLASNTSVGIATANAYTAVAQFGTITYGISGQPPGLSINSSSGVVSGTPTDASGSPYTATVTASNGVLPNALRSVTFNVVPAINSAATVNGQTGVSLPPYSITSAPGPAFTSCANLDPLPAGLTRTGCTISGTPTTIGGPTSVRLTGSNAFGTSAQFTVQFTITLGPSNVTNAVLTASGGEAVAFTPYQITGDNGPTSFNATGLPSGLGVSAGGLITGTPASGSAGTYNVTLSATNAIGTGNTKILVITISQFAPVVTSLAPPAGQTGIAYSFQITANNGPTSFNAANLPPGLAVDTTTGLISGTPTAAGTFNTATITATNGTGSDTKTVTFTITLGPPVISSPAAAGGAVGFAFSYQIVASNSPSSYNATGLPPNVTINTGTGLISGTPTANGVYNATISATNSTATTSQGLTITIAVGIPVITSALTASGSTGNAFSYQIVASNGPGSFTATGLPAGLAIDGTTGRITGTPTTPGMYSVNLGATNATGTGTAVLGLQLVRSAPVITSPPTAGGMPGVPFSYQVVNASGGASTYGATGLPPGLSIDTTTGRITGTPTAGGTFNVVITVSNGTGTATFNLRITIGFLIPVAADATFNVAYETGMAITLPVTGDVFSVTIVTLPQHGLVTTQPNSNIVIYTPALGYSGPDSFTYTVTNPAGTSKAATVNIVVGTAVPVASPAAMQVPLNTPTALDMSKFVRGSQITGVAVSTNPLHGTVAVNGLTITYTPRTNYFGPDSFAYIAFGSAGSSTPATIQVEVTGRPDPTQDREVMGLAAAQAEAARRFSNAQVSNFTRRMESLHRSPQASPAPAAAARETPAPAVAAAPQPAIVPRALDPDRGTRGAAGDSTSGGWLPVSLVSTLMHAATTRSLDVAAASDSGGGGGTGLPFTSGTAFWIAGTANFGNIDARGEQAGMRFGTDGISLGADRRVSDRLALGIGAGYARDDTDVGDNSRSKAKGASIAAYGSYQPTPRTFIDMLLGYGTLRFDSRRFIEPLDAFATGRRNGRQVFGSVAAGYEHRDRNLLISPYARVDFALDRLDESSESGAAGYELTFGKATQKSVQAVAGVRVESKHETEFGFVSPRARVEYRRELESAQRVTLWYTDLIGGPEYAMTPSGVSRNALLLGVGADLVFRGGLRFGLDYTAQRASGASNVQGVRLMVTQELDLLSSPAWRWEPTTFKYPINVDAGYAWDDNVSRGRIGEEKKGDSIFSLGLNQTRTFSLNSNMRAVVTGLASGEKLDRYQGLGRFSAGVQGEVQYRTSGAFDAYTFAFVGRALYERFESSLRTGPRFFAGANVRRSITDRIDLFAEVGANARNGRSDVFRWRDWSAKANVDWTPGFAKGVMYFTGEYRHGDTSSSGLGSLENLAAAEVVAPDDVFGPGFFAYRFEARTVVGTLGFNHPLGPRDSVDLSWRRVEVTPTKRPSFDFDGPWRYIDNQYSLVYLLRF